MKLRIMSTFTDSAQTLCDCLIQASLDCTVCVDEPTERFELRLASGVPGEALPPLLRAIAPFQPTLIPGATLEGVEAELHLGEAKDLQTGNLILHPDSPVLTARLRAAGGTVRDADLHRRSHSRSRTGAALHHAALGRS